MTTYRRTSLVAALAMLLIAGALALTIAIDAATRASAWDGVGFAAATMMLAAVAVLVLAVAGTRRLSAAALVDSLTGLPNRRMFQESLATGMRTSRRQGDRSALLLIDLDRFKEVNDTLGHQAGDELLIAVALRLGPLMPPNAVFSRLGGDEFAILLTDLATTADARILADQLVRSLGMPFGIAGRAVQIGGSAGIALYPEHGTDSETLMSHADTAMYQAKRSHVGAAMYTEANDSNTARRLTLTAGLREAVRLRQLVVLYQPRLNLRTGEVVGVEALARWNHPELGLIGPTEFIQLAEETGAIRMITDYVITQVFEHWAADHHLGRGLPVSVNLSTRDLLDAELPARVDLLTKHWAIDQRWLTFEITETAAIADATTAGTVVAMLRKAGSKVAIDDFGTGYFSLVGLSRLSIDELKIDCRFVHAMLEHQRDAMIVRSIIRLGHDLGLTVVAEGVDSPGVVRELRELGCDEAQGNHLGRPMAMFELRRWLAARSSIAGPGIAGPEAQPRPARVAADVAEQPV